jgi:hypothetical protein
MASRSFKPHFFSSFFTISLLPSECTILGVSYCLISWNLCVRIDCEAQIFCYKRARKVMA